MIMVEVVAVMRQLNPLSRLRKWLSVLSSAHYKTPFLDPLMIL